MKRYFQNLKSAENRRMRYFLLAYLLAGSVGLGTGILFYSIKGAIVAILVTYFLGWKLTALVYAKVKVPCPLCDAQELTENFTLQCRPAKYKCKECNSVM